MDPLSSAVAAVSIVLAVAMGTVHVVRRRRRQARDAEVLREKQEKNLHIPRSLHPVIDTDICIGSLSCLKACPEGDILGIQKGAATLVHADHCIGHGRCAAECPVQAIRLVMGTSERGVDLPELDQYFESSRPGVHVVGELGGMGLLRNAIRQGLQVAKRLDQTLPRSDLPGGAEGVVDVVVVGAGAAGLSTACALQEAGRSYRLLEQGTWGGTMFHYPRRKIVMTEPATIPGYGKIGKKVISKEELLETWGKAIEKMQVKVEEGISVTGIEGEDGAFSVHTTKGIVEARKVVLACGRRGTPRKMGVPGEELEKVTYGFTEAEQYEGRRVLVVGGGDSALEAAIAIAQLGTAEVALSYRGAELSRARQANRDKVAALAESGQLTLLLPSQVKYVSRDEVRLDWDGRELRLPNDDVIVNIGGDPPDGFLKKAGVEMRRYSGEQLGAKIGEDHVSESELQNRRRLRRTLALYGLLGATIVAYLAWKGWDYYRLDTMGRLRSPMHKAFKSAGSWGHGVGIVATAFMLSNFLYPVRKRARSLTGLGDIRDWLNFHVFVGFMSPLVIAFHAAFQSNNVLATATAAALGIVVGTGLIGRFIYGMVPSVGGHAEELELIAGRFERLRGQVEPMLAGARERGRLDALVTAASRDLPRGSLLTALLKEPLAGLQLRMRLWRVRFLFTSPSQYARFSVSILRLRRLRFQLAFYGGLRNLLRNWRVMHASLAVFLVFVMTVHIGFSLYLGYGLK
ncbi:MAG TPA: NAD(P)-binding domain-containing protein [Anaeromyxobacteraceae bacterium]|nr:NAD(P)-binding domain-containing protein [Anaeromyxobacteraceae bacterium]